MEIDLGRDRITLLMERIERVMRGLALAVIVFGTASLAQADLVNDYSVERSVAGVSLLLTHSDSVSATQADSVSATQVDAKSTATFTGGSDGTSDENSSEAISVDWLVTMDSISERVTIGDARAEIANRNSSRFVISQSALQNRQALSSVDATVMLADISTLRGFTGRFAEPVDFSIGSLKSALVHPSRRSFLNPAPLP